MWFFQILGSISAIMAFITIVYIVLSGTESSRVYGIDFVCGFLILWLVCRFITLVILGGYDND